MTHSTHPELPYWQSLATASMVYSWPLYEMQRMRSATSPRRTAIDGFAGDSPESTWRWANTFTHARELLGPGGSRVVMPNTDTLYTNAWLDLTQGPVVLSLPDTGSRYYVLGLLDFYTNPFGHIGTRTTGNGAGQVLIAPPGWDGEIPAQFGASGRHLQAPTHWVWLIGRLLVDGIADVSAVNTLQDRFAIQTWADWLAGRPSKAARFDARHEYRQPFSVQNFLRIVNEALAENPPPAQETRMVRSWRPVGLGLAPQAVVDLLERPLMRDAWAAASASVRALLDMQADRLGHDTTQVGWITSMMSLGDDFGDDYLVRAFVAKQGIGALSPREAIYPRCDCDANGEPLHGAHAYRIRFASDQLPPVDAFWSITLYDSRDNMLVENPIRRYAIGDRTPGLSHDLDGGLTLVVQHDAPVGDAQRANWLPAPEGQFFLCLRAYLPRPAMLDGSYRLPVPERF